MMFKGTTCGYERSQNVIPVNILSYLNLNFPEKGLKKMVTPIKPLLLKLSVDIYFNILLILTLKPLSNENRLQIV